MWVWFEWGRRRQKMFLFENVERANTLNVKKTFDKRPARKIQPLM